MAGLTAYNPRTISGSELHAAPGSVRPSAGRRGPTVRGAVLAGAGAWDN